MRLFLISLGVVLLTVIALLTARFWGLATPSTRFAHPFWDHASAKPWIGVRVSSLDEAKRVTSLRPDAILWLDVRITADRQLLVLGQRAEKALVTEKNFRPETWKGPQLSRYQADELRVLVPDLPLFKDFVDALPGVRLIARIVDNVPDADLIFTQGTENLDLDQRLLLQSETDVILRTIKDKRPKWLFGASQADLMRLLSFESIGLAPVIGFRGDVLVTSLTVAGRPALNQGVVDEIHRRQKQVYIGPLEDGSEYDAARQFSPDALILSSPELFHTLSDQNRL